MAGPTCAKTPSDCGARGLQETQQTTQIISEAMSSCKPFLELREAFKRRGHEFYRSIAPDGRVTYFAQKWSMERAFASIDAARAFLHQIGGAL